MSDVVATVDSALAKPPIRFRRLRVAVSLFFGVLAVALVVLWIRSYRGAESIGRNLTKNGMLTQSGVFSWNGTMSVHTRTGKVIFPASQGWRYRRNPDYEPQLSANQSPIYWVYTNEHKMIRLPYGCIVSVMVVISITLWIQLRFSLRTLLIATTLVAAVLGLVVWSTR